MNTLKLGILMILALVLAACSADTPTQVAGADDDMLARVVAGVAGYESTGFAATVNDLIIVGNGGTLRPAAGTLAVSTVVVTHSDSIFDPSTRTQMLALACQRQHGDVVSDWDLRYSDRFAELVRGTQGYRLTHPLDAKTSVDGTFRSGTMVAKGTSGGTLKFLDAPASSTRFEGEYRWRGGVTFGGQQAERFDDVSVVITSASVAARPAAERQEARLEGKCEVTVRANGPDGVVSRAGTLTFDGSEIAVLGLGGRRYSINVREGVISRTR